MATKAITGTAGAEGCDGWVAWTTSDEGFSWQPALHCGTFTLVIGRGRIWGAASDARMVVSLHIENPMAFSNLDTRPVEGSDYDGLGEASREVQIGRAELVACCVRLAMAAGHPSVDNVAEAAVRIWEALEAQEPTAKQVADGRYLDCLRYVAQLSKALVMSGRIDARHDDRLRAALDQLDKIGADPARFS